MIKLSYKYKLLLSFTATFAVFAAVLVAFEMSHEQSYATGCNATPTWQPA